MKKQKKKILFPILLLFFMVLIVGKPQETYAYTYTNSRTESINYRATFLNGQDVTTANGGKITLNNAGNCDNIWMNGFSAWLTGDYSGGVNYTTHRHNAGWGTTLENGNLLVGDTSHYQWIEAISLKTTGNINNYYYIEYQGYCVPVTQSYLVQASGGSASNLDRLNPGWRQDYANGQPLWYKWIQAGQNIATGVGLSTGAPDGSNFCGTAGYSLPINGFGAVIVKYSSALTVNPNGGNCEGNTSTYTISGLNADGTVNIADPTRTGYEFTGWTITSVEYQSRTAETCQQQPEQNVAPVATAGNGTAIYNGIDYSAVYDYNYYKSHNADLQAAFGSDASAYLNHFINYGMAEGRRGNEAFNVAAYKSTYADVRAAFGTDLKSYYIHYMQNGIYEGRTGNGQDVQTCTASSIYLGNAKNVTIRANWKSKNYTVHFEGNGATGGSMSDQSMQYDVAQNLSKNAFVRNFQVNYDVNGGSSTEKSSDSAASDFTGWKVSAGAINISYTDEQLVKNIAKPGETRNLYARWHDNSVTLPNASKADEYKIVDEEHKGWVKYYFTGWYTEPEGGQCVGRGGDSYTPQANVTLYAHWSYQVCISYDGNTNDGGGMEMDDPLKGDIKPYGKDYIIRENGYTKTGYDFFGWNTAQIDGAGKLIEDGKEKYAPGSIYNEDIPLTLFAAWRTRFDIAYMGVCQTEGDDYFDNNGGEDYSQLSGTVILSKSNDMKIDTTKSFIDQETGEKIVEDVTGTGVGWAFAKDIEAKYTEAYIADGTEYTTSDFFHIAREAGGLTYGSVSPDYQGTVPALNSSDMAVANMYRVWDYGPLIEAYDLYYTLEQAQNGYITEEELLSHAKATDEEDGEIMAGDNEDQGNSFHVWDYAAADFTSFTASGSVTETYLAIDSAGNRTKLMVTIHVTDSTPYKVMPEGTTRFISEKYYNTSEDAGGLSEDSLWETAPDYVETINLAFQNEKNDTPEETYTFSHEDIQNMQEFIEENGMENAQSEDALMRFYNQFMAPNRK